MVMPDYDPELLMQAGRGSRGDDDVKRWLRGRSDEECFDFITRCLRVRGYDQEKRALDLATSCIRRPAHALSILRTGLVSPDASSIKFWLAFAIKKLGARKVVAEISALLETHPTSVDMALYWLPSLLPPSDGEDGDAFKALCDEAARRGIVGGQIPKVGDDGQTLFKDVRGTREKG